MKVPARTALRALSMAVLALSAAAPGCGKQDPIRGPDFSKANSVSVALGIPDEEYGTGLQHLFHEKDGLTTTAIMDGVPCRYLKVTEFNPGYLYFTLHPTFKRRSVKNVNIEVEFYDQGSGELGLQYDASKSGKYVNTAYAFLETVTITDSRQWRTVSFRVRNATFQGAQNSGSDFRLLVSPPELYVRRVTVTRAK